MYNNLLQVKHNNFDRFRHNCHRQEIMLSFYQLVLDKNITGEYVRVYEKEE